MYIVNLFGAPGAGKSTGAAYIFSQLKMKGINAEYVSEFAKEKVWEESKEAFKNQAYLFGKQYFRISRCKDKVDIIVTDSPLPLSILYNRDDNLGEEFDTVVMNVFNSFKNFNYYINRTKPYNPKGRLQTEKESDELVNPLKNLLNIYKIDFEEFNGEATDYDKIVEDIISKINEE